MKNGSFLVLKADADVLIAHGTHHLAELRFAILLGFVDVFLGQAAVQHLLVGFAIERLTVFRRPFAALKETLAAGFVNEVAVK